MFYRFSNRKIAIDLLTFLIMIPSLQLLWPYSNNSRLNTGIQIGVRLNTFSVYSTIPIGNRTHEQWRLLLFLARAMSSLLAVRIRRRDERCKTLFMITVSRQYWFQQLSLNRHLFNMHFVEISKTLLINPYDIRSK